MMIDVKKVNDFIGQKRKELRLTQQQLANKLAVSFQAVSKWENGGLPNIEILDDLARVLQVSVDELLSGGNYDQEGMSYRKAGVDIAYSDMIKQAMKKYLKTKDSRVLNGLGAFASLYDLSSFSMIKEPVLALKSEEPGSKQKLAMEYGYIESICHDMINHLVNDIIVMQARPLAVLDTIVCGNAEKETITTLVKGISEACLENECSLVGGETSIQPAVVERGIYVLTSSIVGIVDKTEIVDGSKIENGDVVLAIASNGLHTNGYSLVRMLMDKYPGIKLDKIEGKTFIEQIMKPHRPYYQALKGLFGKSLFHGMAHITGGGIEGNLSRVIPNGLTAEIDLSKIKVLPLFKYIKNVGNIDEYEMLNTFNCGVGFIVVVSSKDQEIVMNHLNRFYDCYQIGTIKTKEKAVEYINEINWL